MSEMAEVRILFFAQLKDLAGKNRITLQIPAGTTVAGLRQILETQFPLLQTRIKTTLVSINQEFALDGDLIPEGAEIALFPPVSGGSGDLPTIFSITEDALDLDDLVDRITLVSSGAACIFSGMVRGETVRGEAHTTTALEYEAYKPMAEAKMAQVADEIRARWPAIQGIAIVQRIGLLQPRTPTVLIACTAAHRDTGVFEAARYGIDRLKEIVPVWKKEIGPDGQEWIEGAYIPGKED
ncbi:MAG TPA: molybdenum cofactor biosynthesis protein MoaE [Bellilinea sp.]|jgi:molybdopterin synthase catalytic subunit|nr:molybdenum cofactor biosynthesis protein MoaE [Bellilinea sp.]